MRNVVIIGAGIAGVQAAASLSGRAEVTLIGNESFPPYYRMRIEEIIGGADPGKLLIHPLQWYGEKGIAFIQGEACRIDTEARSVILRDGSSLPYDSLVIATGSKANILPLGGERKVYFSLRTMADAFSIKQKLDSGIRRVTIIGGGLLGLELASSIASHLEEEVTVLESAPWILPRQLDRDSASLLERLLLGKGVKVIAGCSARSADEGNLYLEDGRAVPSEMIIFSSGVHADLSLLEGTGISAGRGIIVDSRLRTDVPDIYAIGDAAELDGRCFGLAAHAREMGSFVASSILGEEGEYVPSAPSAILKVGGLDVASFGTMDGEMIVTEGKDMRRTLFVRDGIVRGAVLIGDKPSMMAVRNMVGKSYEDS